MSGQRRRLDSPLAALSPLTGNTSRLVSTFKLSLRNERLLPAAAVSHPCSRNSSQGFIFSSEHKRYSAPDRTFEPTEHGNAM